MSTVLTAAHTVLFRYPAEQYSPTFYLVGIRVLEHVVVGDGSYVSFLERGLLGGASRQ